MTRSIVKRKVFVIAGEASGDVLGGALMKSLKNRYGEDNIEFQGVGGDSMADEGLDSLLPMSELCVMGLVEVLEHLPRLLRLMTWIASKIEDFNPDAVVFIDLPDFNFRVARLLKKRDHPAKCIHYVAPTVWAWRPGRAKAISRFLDGLMCLFPFEPEYFTQHGLSAAFVGHPLVERRWYLSDFEKEKAIKSFKKDKQIPDNAKLLAVMFGSRISEFKSHASIFQQTLEILKEQEPNLHLIVPTLPHLQFEVMSLLGRLKIPAYVFVDKDEKWAALAGVEGALAVSGTVALELAYADVPHIVAYRASWVTWVLLRLLVKTKFAHLANILLGKMVVPELLQNDCAPDKLAARLLRLIGVPQLAAQQKAGFKILRQKLQTEGLPPSEKAAEYVAQTLGDA